MTVCPGCGLALAEVHEPSHPYLGASAACWSLYADVLGTIYGDAARMPLLQLVVDTYAVQHPGTPGRRSARSVGIHLLTLCLCLESGADPVAVARLHKQAVERRVFPWLEPPPSRGSLNVRDVAAAGSLDDYESVVWDWARDVWEAWSPQHAVVRSWVDARL